MLSFLRSRERAGLARAYGSAHVAQLRARVLLAWALLGILVLGDLPPAVSHSTLVPSFVQPDDCLGPQHGNDDEPSPPHTVLLRSVVAPADQSVWHAPPDGQAPREQLPSEPVLWLAENTLLQLDQCDPLAWFDRF